MPLSSEASMLVMRAVPVGKGFDRGLRNEDAYLRSWDQKVNIRCQGLTIFSPYQLKYFKLVCRAKDLPAW